MELLFTLDEALQPGDDPLIVTLDAYADARDAAGGGVSMSELLADLPSELY